jgi:hypothetical protein
LTARSILGLGGPSLILILLPAIPARAQYPRPSPSPTPPGREEPGREEPGREEPGREERERDKVPGRDQSPDVIGTERPTSTFLFSLGIHGGYESNIEFFVPDGPSDAWGTVRASLGHTRRSPRGHFSLSLDGAGTRYQDIRTFDHIDGAGSIAASRRLSERSTLSFSGGASYLPTELSRTLITSGLVLPRDSTLGISGGLGLDVRSGDKGTIAINVLYDSIDFDSPDLLDTQSANGTFRLSRKLSTRSDLSFTYGFLGTFVEDSRFDNHWAALGWTRQVHRRLSLSLASGLGYSREPLETDEVAEGWHYYGTAALDGRIRGATVSLQFRRSVNPAYGLGGNLLSYGALLSASIPIGRRALLSFSGVHTWSEDPTSQTEQFVSDDGTGSFSFQFLRDLGMVLAYGYRRSDPAAGEVVESYRASIGFIYTFSRPSARY